MRQTRTTTKTRFTTVVVGLIRRVDPVPATAILTTLSRSKVPSSVVDPIVGDTV